MGLAFAVALLLGSPVVVSAADAQPDGETYTWNIAGASYLEPSFYSSAANLTRYPSNGGEYTVGVILGSEESTALAGRGPHGGYDTTTMKCQTCHSAHGADAPSPPDYQGNSLLRAGSTGCEYCHLNSSVAASTQVYLATNGNPAIDSVEATVSGHSIGQHANVPDSSLEDFNLSCGSCHSVHAADAQLWKPTDFYQDPAKPTIPMSTAVYGYKLLKANPDGDESSVATFAASSNPTTDPATINQYASAVWCMDCHDARMTATSTEPLTAEDTNTNPGYLGLTESFETTTFRYDVGAGQITYGADTWAPAEDNCPAPRKAPLEGLYQGPSQCYNCHRGGLQPLADGLAPEDTTQAALLAKIEGSGAGYLQNANDDQGELDCSTCHYAPADFAADDKRRSGEADWPHSSGNDFKLLGDWTVDPSVDSTATVAAPIPGGMTEQSIPRYVCGRCHPTDDGVTFAISNIISRHYQLSIQNVVTTNTAGLLGTFYSPGWPKP